MTMILCFNYMLYRYLSFTKHFYMIPICFAKKISIISIILNNLLNFAAINLPLSKRHTFLLNNFRFTILSISDD